jgi:UDP-N-acetylmuramyl pentapeptide phosphotransferase/UDP-N-acetylglucosamine-1-phosphate transferase
MEYIEYISSYLSPLITSFPFLIGVFSFLIGKLTMPYVLQMAKKKELIVKPNQRTSHEGGIPNIGGINIFTSFFISYMLFSAGYHLFFYQKVVFAGMFFMLLVGFYDDIIELEPRKKLIGELIAGFLLIIVADIRITNFQGFFGINTISDWISYPLSFFVYLLIINALNLIDGVDGLASGIGVIICTFFGVYFQLIGETSLSMMSYALIGALLIFFFYNVFGNQSKIFMGDSGALVLGYMVYMFVAYFCRINAEEASLINPVFVMKSAPVVAICVLAVPLIDTVRVMITRIKQGRSPFEADRNHVHHLLLSTGLRHREVTLVLLIVNLLFIMLGLSVRNLRIEIAALIVIAVACFFIFVLWRVAGRAKQKMKTN